MQRVELRGAESQGSFQSRGVVTQRVEDPRILGRSLDQFGHTIKRHAETSARKETLRDLLFHKQTSQGQCVLGDFTVWDALRRATLLFIRGRELTATR